MKAYEIAENLTNKRVLSLIVGVGPNHYVDCKVVGPDFKENGQFPDTTYDKTIHDDTIVYHAKVGDMWYLLVAR